MAEAVRRPASDGAVKRENRDAMPQSAKMIDAYVAVFGKLPSGRFTENGKTVEWGKK